MSFYDRLRGRIRHGLLTQELLDRLARLGILFYPYLVYEEFTAAPLPSAPQLPGVVCRKLVAADVPNVAALAGDRCSEHWQERFARGALVVGAFHEAELISCMWCDFDRIRTFGRGGPTLRTLGPGEAALSRAWTVPHWRGRGLVRFIRPRINAALRDMGYERLYSVCLFFNKSVRRSKARLGVPVTQLRLAIGLFGVFNRDLCLRCYPPGTPARLDANDG